MIIKPQLTRFITVPEEATEKPAPIVTTIKLAEKEEVKKKEPAPVKEEVPQGLPAVSFYLQKASDQIEKIKSLDVNKGLLKDDITNIDEEIKKIFQNSEKK